MLHEASYKSTSCQKSLLFCMQHLKVLMEQFNIISSTNLHNSIIDVLLLQYQKQN